MADLNQAQEELAQQLSRLGAALQNTNAVLGGFGSGVRSTGSNVGQGLVRLRSDIDRSRVSYRDATAELRRLERQFDNLDDAVKQSAAGSRMVAMQQKISAQLIGQGVGQAVTDLGKVGLVGAFEYYKNQTMVAAKSMQENVGGMEMAFRLQNQALEDQAKILSGFGDTTAAAAASLAMIPGGQAMAGVFAASTIAFKGLSSLISGSAEGFKILQIEISKTDAAFKVSTNAGALFANGMTDVREQAALAGLDIKDFAEITARNSDAFTRIGGSVADGVKRFSAINREMSVYRQGLINVGYSIEDQAQATAEYMEMLANAGKLRAGEEEKVAAGAREYLINLKAISSLTGEDVKRTQARIKAANDQAAVQAMLAEGGDEMKAKFDNLIARFPGYEKEISQLMVLGTVTDPIRATMLANNAELDQALRQGVANAKDNNVKVQEAAAANDRAVRENGAAMLANAREQQKIFGLVQTANSGFAEQAELANRNAKLGLQGLKESEAAAKGGKTARENAEAAAATGDELTQAVSGAQVAFRNAADALNQDVTPLIKKFAVEGFGSIEGLLKTVTEGDKKVRETLKAVTGVVEILKPGALRGGIRPPTPLRPEDRSPMLPGGGTTEEVPAGTLGLNNTRELNTQLASAMGESTIGIKTNTVTLSSEFSNNFNNQFKDSFIQAMASYQNQKMSSFTSKGINEKDLSTSVTTAFQEVFSGPGSINQVLTNLQNTLESDKQKQIAVLETQNEKLETLIATMQDNVDYSKRIADNIA